MRAKRRMKTAALAWLVAVMAVTLVGCGERGIEPPMPEAGQTSDAFVQESLAMGADDSKQRAATEGEAAEQASAQSSGQSAETGSEFEPSAAPSGEPAVPSADASPEGSGSGNSGAKETGKTSNPGSGDTKAEVNTRGDDGKGDSDKGDNGQGSSVKSNDIKSNDIKSNDVKSDDVESDDDKSGKSAASAVAATPSTSPSSSAENPPKLASASPSASGNGAVKSEKDAAASLSPEASASPTPASPSPESSPKPNKENSGPETLTFSELYAEETVRGLKMSDKVNELNSQEVEMIGYMAPPLTATVHFFVLTKVAMSICPFCSTDADWPSDIVVVFMPSGKEIKPTEHEVKVTGTLSVGSQTDEETGFVSLIRISADKVEVLK